MPEDKKTLITNRQAKRDYFIVKTFEAGISLKGNEVKSLRSAKANLKGSFARIEKGEVFLCGMHISPYKYSRDEENPLRERKLLMHKHEIHQLEVKSLQQGFTIIPTKVYFARGKAKVELALARGKKLYDKRTALKEKQAKREIDRAVRGKK